MADLTISELPSVSVILDTDMVPIIRLIGGVWTNYQAPIADPVSVASANGLAGTVANPTTAPVITLMGSNLQPVVLITIRLQHKVGAIAYRFCTWQ